MAVAAPKIAVHLYLNNPYGLISATIPNYSINKVELADKMSPIVDTEYQDTENISKVAKANNVEPEVPKARGMQKPEVQDSLNKKWKPLPDIKPGTRTTTSGEYYTPSATVFFAKPSGNNQRMGGDPNLGFTWSINLDKKEKILSPRQPPPPSLLDKLGRLKKVDHFGKTNKNQEKLLASSRYIIKKLDVSDSKQRKMSEKLSEWLDQYTAVSQNQQHYLSRIHELRRGLETKEDKHLMQTIENLRSQHKEKYKRKFPIYSLTRMEGTAVNQGPAPFPSRPCLYHDDKHGIPKLKIAPHTSPRKLAPIVKRADTKYTVIKNEHKKHQVTPRPEMSSMRTEYETFESIARRNKLNLPQFFNQTNGNYRKVGNKRLPMSVSTVTIIEEHPEEDTEHKAFTSDHLSKKHTVTLKDQKPG